MIVRQSSSLLWNAAIANPRLRASEVLSHFTTSHPTVLLALSTTESTQQTLLVPTCVGPQWLSVLVACTTEMAKGNRDEKELRAAKVRLSLYKSGQF